MPESDPTNAPPRRRWYRLHLSTWLMLPLGLVVAALVLLPGELKPGRSELQFAGFWSSSSPFTTGHDNDEIVHGWPFPFLWRAPQNPPAWADDPASAGAAFPWKFEDSVQRFSLLALLGDVGLVGACFVVLLAVAEWRRRRRRAMQFSLRGLLLFAALAAVALGWWGHQRTVSRDAQGHLRAMEGATDLVLAPRLPLWMWTIAGDGLLSRLGMNGPAHDFSLSWMFERGTSQWADIRYLVEQYPDQATVCMSGFVSSNHFDAMISIDRLEHVSFRLTGTVPDEFLARLASLPQLKSLSIDYSAQPEAQSFVGISGFRRLEEFECTDATLAPHALDFLGDLPRLRRLSLSRSQFENADLKSLTRLNGLESLDLSETNLDDAGAHELRRLRGVRRLSVEETQLTKVGINDLLDPSPISFAHDLEQIDIDADLVDGGLMATLKKLPRLRRVSVAWPQRRNLFQAPNPIDPNYRRLLAELQNALPGCQILDHPVGGF